MTTTFQTAAFCARCGELPRACDCSPRHRSNEKKSPAAAALLSVLIPGLGQLYNGEEGKALLFFVLWVLVLPWPIAVLDAYYSARLKNLEQRVAA